MDIHYFSNGVIQYVIEPGIGIRVQFVPWIQTDGDFFLYTEVYETARVLSHDRQIVSHIQLEREICTLNR
jgi:hypothetical protein